MTSHKLHTFTFISPQGFIVEGMCTCGYKTRQPPTLEHKQAMQAVELAHDTHVIEVLERVWIGGVPFSNPNR